MPRTNAAARELVIAEYLKALRLPTFATEYLGLVRQVREGGWNYEGFLRELLEMELRFVKCAPPKVSHRGPLPGREDPGAA
jgi:hypothetical protein